MLSLCRAQPPEWSVTPQRDSTGAACSSVKAFISLPSHRPEASATARRPVRVLGEPRHGLRIRKQVRQKDSVLGMRGLRSVPRRHWLETDRGMPL